MSEGRVESGEGNYYVMQNVENVRTRVVDPIRTISSSSYTGKTGTTKGVWKHCREGGDGNRFNPHPLAPYQMVNEFGFARQKQLRE